jgi:phosphatidylglycerophosphate synthase
LGATAGERWTRAALRDLAARSYSPGAIADFLAASQRRAGDVARERPELVRQAGRWVGVGLVPWAIVARRDGPSAAGRGLAWWCACGAMLYWHLGMLETPDGRPRPLGGADALTLTRAWLVPLAWEHPTAAVCALGGLTDALDGLVARRGEPTRAGRDLEGVVDSCLALATLRGCARHDLLARAAVAAEACRLGAGLAYSTASYFGRLSPPSRSVLDAGRALSPLRLASLVLAARGRRTGASVLLAGAAAAAVLEVALATRRGWAP